MHRRAPMPCWRPCEAWAIRRLQRWQTSSTTALQPALRPCASNLSGPGRRAGSPSLTTGAGMTDAGLQEAMTLGVRNPLDERVAEDLGRFGMGLKTASFSQCRSLTVATARDGRDGVPALGS